MNVNPDDTRFCSVKPINFDTDCFSFCQGLNSVGWSLPGQNPVLTHCFTVSSQNKYRNTFNFKPQQQIFSEKQTDADPCELLQQSLESPNERRFCCDPHIQDCPLVLETDPGFWSRKLPYVCGSSRLWDPCVQWGSALEPVRDRDRLCFKLHSYGNTFAWT